MVWYTLGPGCTVDVCLCGKHQAVAAGELNAARRKGAAVACASTQTRLVTADVCAARNTRFEVLRRHLALCHSIQHLPVADPVAASADSIVNLLRELIAIPSVNPDQVLKSGANPLTDPNCGEFRLAQCLAEKFRDLGAEVVLEDCSPSWIYRDDVGPGFSPRQNIYAVFQTSSSHESRWLAIDTHLDTVMVNGMAPYGAFDATLTEDGKVHGRGACDTKATFALVLAIFQERKSRGLPLLPDGTNLVVCGTVGEETGRLGANYFREFLYNRGIYIDEMIVAEPTLCTPVTGHKGNLGLQFNLKGTAAHSSKPHLGKNALVAASELILRMMQEHDNLQSSRSGPLGAPTITPTLGSGGHGPNIVPQDASVFIDYRVTTAGDTTETEDVEEVYDRLVEIAHEVLDDSPHCDGFDVINAFLPLVGNPSFFQDPESAFVKKLASWSGNTPEVVTFGTNATAYDTVAEQGIVKSAESARAPAVVAVESSANTTTSGSTTMQTQQQRRVYNSCVVMGPGDISQAHMADEWIEICELQKMRGILEKWFGH